jgi:hypothetical protein
MQNARRNLSAAENRSIRGEIGDAALASADIQSDTLGERKVVAEVDSAGDTTDVRAVRRQMQLKASASSTLAVSGDRPRNAAKSLMIRI